MLLNFILLRYCLTSSLLQHLKELEKEKHIMQQNLNDKEKKHEGA